MNIQKRIKDKEAEIERLKETKKRCKKYEFYRLAGEINVRINQIMKRILILQKKWQPTRNSGKKKVLAKIKKTAYGDSYTIKLGKTMREIPLDPS